MQTAVPEAHPAVEGGFDFCIFQIQFRQFYGSFRREIRGIRFLFLVLVLLELGIGIHIAFPQFFVTLEFQVGVIFFGLRFFQIRFRTQKGRLIFPGIDLKKNGSGFDFFPFCKVDFHDLTLHPGGQRYTFRGADFADLGSGGGIFSQSCGHGSNSGQLSLCRK